MTGVWGLGSIGFPVEWRCASSWSKRFVSQATGTSLITVNSGVPCIVLSEHDDNHDDEDGQTLVANSARRTVIRI